LFDKQFVLFDKQISEELPNNSAAGCDKGVGAMRQIEVLIIVLGQG